MKMSAPRAFVREATGFVRELGALDSTIFAIAAMVGPTWIPVFAWLWFAMPGIDIPLAMFIMAVLGAIHGLYYVLITTAMPRTASGGYVALSRVVHPALGMASGMILIIAYLIDLAFISNISVTIGVGSPIATYGILTGNPGLQAMGEALAADGGKNVYGFIVSLVFILIVFGIATLGMRRIILVNRVAMFFATLGMVLIAAVLLSISREEFVRLYNAFAGPGAYDAIIQAAHEGGWSIPSEWVVPTLMGLPLAYFAYLGYHFPTYMGGEMKRATRTMTVTVLGSIAYVGFWFVLLAVLFIRTVGQEFLTSMGFLYFSGSEAYPLSVPPWVNTYLIIINSNPIINFFVILSFLAFGYFLCINYFVIPSRIMFAWAFDRAAPARFADISDKWHSPVFLNGILMIIGMFLAVIYNFTPFLGPVNLAFFFIIAFLPEGLAGILLPWKKKDLFEASAPIVKKKVGGMPLIVLLGAYGVLLNIALVILSLMNPNVIGDINPVAGGGLFNWSAVIVMAVAGVALLYIMRSYYKSKGIPVELIFKEVPPE